jgi:acetyl esterase/lipase
VRLWGGASAAIVGAEDDVAPPEEQSRVYAEALKARGIDVRLRVVAGLGHNNIVFQAPVFQVLVELIGEVESASPVSP